jgi:hypothetical protein
MRLSDLSKTYSRKHTISILNLNIRAQKRVCPTGCLHIQLRVHWGEVLRSGRKRRSGLLNFPTLRFFFLRHRLSVHIPSQKRPIPRPQAFTKKVFKKIVSHKTGWISSGLKGCGRAYMRCGRLWCLGERTLTIATHVDVRQEEKKT